MDFSAKIKEQKSVSPGSLGGVVVNITFGTLVVIAGVLPWWRRIVRGTNQQEIRRRWRTLISTISVGIMTYRWMYTLVDAHTTNANGDVVLCGNSYSFMLDSSQEHTEGLPHACIVHSRIAIALLVLSAFLVLLIERWILHLVFARSHLLPHQRKT